MMKIVTMHQPNYLPWIGLFSKIAHSDSFIIVGDVQYSTNSVINRNKIRTNGGWTYLTIPVGRKINGLKICDVRLPRNKKWMENHWRTIRNNYVKADFFSLYEDFFEKLYQKDFEYLWQINVEIITFLLKCFKIDVEVTTTCELGVDTELQKALDPELKKTELLIPILKSVGADIYLSGPSGRNYLDLEKFPQNDIDLRFFKFQHPIYKQTYLDFEPAMSAIDLLFNLGPQASEIIKASGSIED